MDKPVLSYSETQDHKFLNALAEAFRVHEAVLNATDLPIFSITPFGVINSFNRSSELLLGYRSEELIGKETPMLFLDLTEVTKRADHASAFLGAAPDSELETLTYRTRIQKIPSQEEWTFVRKNGDRLPVQLSVSGLWDEHEQLTGYVFVARDITDRKLIVDRAKASEEKFRLLAENIPGAIYLCNYDESYSIVFVNDHIETITGYSAGDFMSGTIRITDLLDKEEERIVDQKIHEAIHENRRYHLQYRMKNRSGEWRWVDEVGIGVYADGKAIMLEGYFRDITAEKEAEQKLQAIVSENFRVFNNPVTLNAVAGFDKYFKRLSPAWSTLLGYSEEELLSKPFTELIHPDDIKSTRDAAFNIAEGNALLTFENRYRCKDGSYRWLLWGSASDAERGLIYATAVDITERKRSEEELLHSKENIESIAIKLQEQNKRLDEFAHIISHNLRSPIGNIQALINLLDETSSINDYKNIFDKLRNLSKNLGQTMNDLMDTLKANASTDLQKIEIRFKDLLSRVIQSLEGELIHSEASVTFDFNEAPVIHYPKAYLESIFQNLLSNAIKYRQKGRKPTIHFHTEIQRGGIVLTVTDNGQGIDMEKYGDKLFGLHYTFHQHEEARGVGLFLIKTQIESMGGSIHATSKVGEGTTFTIYF